MSTSVTEPRKKTLVEKIEILKRFLFFCKYARKAVVAFLAAGGGSALGSAIATFDFTNLTWGNLWTGLGAGMVSALIVYWTTNAPQEAHNSEGETELG